MIQFDEHIFQMGWNHQPDLEQDVRANFMSDLGEGWDRTAIKSGQISSRPHTTVLTPQKVATFGREMGHLGNFREI